MLIQLKDAAMNLLSSLVMITAVRWGEIISTPTWDEVAVTKNLSRFSTISSSKRGTDIEWFMCPCSNVSIMKMDSKSSPAKDMCIHNIIMLCMGHDVYIHQPFASRDRVSMAIITGMSFDPSLIIFKVAFPEFSWMKYISLSKWNCTTKVVC